MHNTATMTSLVVLDENQQPVTTPYTLTSAEGLAYPVGVPEPASWVVMAIGLASVGMVRRRGVGRFRHG